MWPVPNQGQQYNYMGVEPPHSGAGVVARFKQDIRCGGRLVWHEGELPVLTGFGTGQDGLFCFSFFFSSF